MVCTKQKLKLSINYTLEIQSDFEGPKKIKEDRIQASRLGKNHGVNSSFWRQDQKSRI